MMDFLRKHMRIIFVVTIVAFLAVTFTGFGGYFFGDLSKGDALVKVNGVKISYRDYSKLFNRVFDELRKSDVEITDAVIAQKRQEVLQDLIQEEVFYQEAKKYGISVSDGELNANIQQYPAFQKDGKFDQRVYFQILTQVLRTLPEEFEESRRRQISVLKLRRLIGSSVKISEPKLRQEYSRTNHGKMDKFNEKREEFLNNLRQEYVSMAFNEWYKEINRKTKIEDFTDKYF